MSKLKIVMDIKSRAELLKMFIEICDTEIFPERKGSVYVVNKSFIGGNETASYNNTKYIKMVLLTPVILFFFALAKITFLVKKSLKNYQNLIWLSYSMRSIKIGFERESYFVKKQKDLLNNDLVKLASIACHEVRHRVQHYHVASFFNVSKKHCENAELLEIYSAGRLNAQESLNRSKVKKCDLECESDAYFIQNIITKLLNDEFPNGSFSFEEFRTFVQENKNLLIWRNPYLK
jgi:uncharacterized membrane-anchored protein